MGVKKYLFGGLAAVLFSGIGSACHAMECILKDNTSTSTFTVKEETKMSTLLQVNGDGNVGIGTTAPEACLHVISTDVATKIQRDTSGTTSGKVTNLILEPLISGSGEPGNNVSFGAGILFRWKNTSGGQRDLANIYGVTGAKENQGDIVFETYNVDTNPSPFNAEVMRITSTGNVGIGTTSPDHPLHMGSGAWCTSGGVWTDASSRDYKENIEDLSLEKALDTFKNLNPVTFNYKKDTSEDYVGFIAEDVPELVATSNRKGLSPMDVTAVLTKVVQEQQRENLEMKKTLLEQQKVISALLQEVKEIKNRI